MPLVTTRRWPGTPPDADPARRAVVLPGLRYPTELPALWAPARALALAGWDVWHAAWDLDGVPDDEARRVVREAAEAMGDGARLVVGKSLGSTAAGWAADHGVPAVWLTPLLTDAKVEADITRSTAPTLLVAGSEDHTWDDEAARACGKEIVDLGPVGHGLMTDDVHADLRLAGRIADLVTQFARRLP